MGVTARPFIGNTKTITSPIDAQRTFDIKRFGLREKLERQNLSSTVRYVDRGQNGDTDMVTERDYPVGSMNLATVRLGLAAWNLEDEQQRPIPITEGTIQDYLDPQEFDFLLNTINDFNPVIANVDDTKKG